MNAKVCASKIGLLIVIAIAAGSALLAAQEKPAFWHITTMYAFTGNADGAVPFGGVVLDPAGNVYGTTAYGGSGGGVVFKVDPRGHESLLHTFTGYPNDGANPNQGVTRDSAGRLYGLTAFLVLYELQPSATFCAAVLCPWKESILYSNFNDGQLIGIPTGLPIVDAQGNIYATSNASGTGTNCSAGCGFAFKVDPQGNETVIYNFQGGSADGGWPTGPLLLAADGSLYGTTDIGGPSGYGTVYKIDPNGNESVLYSFTGGSDGGAPQTGVIADGEGNLYGTTLIGGQSGPGCVYGGNCGVVFKLIPNKNGSWTESVFYSFPGGADGANPTGGLLRDSQGNFYGTTGSGGSCLYGPYCGTVYKLDSAANETPLWNFTAGTDGLEPGYGSLVMDQQGSLYGTTLYGGDNSATNSNCTGFYGPGCGVVFKLTP